MSAGASTVQFSVLGESVSFWLPNQQSDGIQRHIATEKEFYESDLLNDAMRRINPGDLVVDARAGIGNHAIFFSKMCGARVIAFEPSRELFHILRRNVELNGVGLLVDARNVEAGRATPGGAFMAMPQADSGRTPKESGDLGTTGWLRFGDASKDERVALLKIEIEGDGNILQGARALIERDRPLLYVEAASLDRSAWTEEPLLSLGYQVAKQSAHTRSHLLTDAGKPEHMEAEASLPSTGPIWTPRNPAETAAQSEARSGESVDVLAELRSRIANAEEALRALRKSLEDAPASGRSKPQGPGTGSPGFPGRTENAPEAVQGPATQGEDAATDRPQLLNWPSASVGASLSGLGPDALSDETLERIFELQFTYGRRAEAYRAQLQSMLSSRAWRLLAKAEAGARRVLGRKSSSKSIATIIQRIDRANPLPGPTRPRHAPELRPKHPPGAPSRPLSRATFAGLAAIPARAEALRQTVASLLPQVDELGVYLNGWDSIPDFLRHERIRLARSQDHGDIGDAGKFHWVEEHDGYYFSCDDDLVYPRDYASRLIEALRSRDNVAAVGWHGSLVLEPFTDYYDSSSRRVLPFKAELRCDTPVHILGTGCSAFHTSVLRVTRADFKSPNMADVYFALLAQEQHVPLLVVRHLSDEVREVAGSQDASINGDSSRDLESRKNTRTEQTKLVASRLWRTFEWAPLSVLLIGRFNSYKKGGIHKSCHLIAESLRSRGHSVRVLDMEEDLSDRLGGVDLAWIYPGDPERPDFRTVDAKIADLRNAGIPVLVNLSYLYEQERSRWIAKELRRLNDGASLPPVFAAVFAESVLDDPAFSDVEQYFCYVPKTIEATPAFRIPAFHHREGICFGDSTKLANSAIIGGPVHPWIDAVSRRLPHVRLYAYKQYSGEQPHELLKIVPHMQDDFGDFLAARRLFVNLNVHLTFEMVPCEAQALGTPVIYRPMPHSLNEYIGPTGVRVRSPDELAEMAAWLYNDGSSWLEFHRASLANGEAIAVRNANAALEAALRLFLVRARRLQPG